MKRSKRIIALVVVLALICTATFVLTRYEEKQEQIKNSDAVILEIPAEDVQTLSWEYESDGLSFHRSGEGWLYDADEAFPVSGDKIGSILSRFEEFGASFIIENVEDYGQYGLDDPECVIRLETADRSYDIRLGAFSKMDEQRYVDVGDGNVYLVSSDPMDVLETTLSAMIEHDDTPAFGTVTEITFSGSENYTVSMVEDSGDTYSSDDIYFAQLDGESLPLDTDTVTDYLNTITRLDLLDYATYNATEEELAAFGLDEPELSVTVNYTQTGEDKQEIAGSFVLHIGQNAEEQTAYLDALNAGEDDLPDVTKYVRIGDSQIVYRLDATDHLTLAAAGYDDLRHREVFWGSFDLLTQIDVSLEGETHTLSYNTDAKDEDEWFWSFGGEKTDISDLWNALTGLSAESFTGETPTEKEEISLTLYLDSDSFPRINIRLYRYNGSLCLASVNGETVSLVERSAVMDLVEAVQSIVLN